MEGKINVINFVYEDLENLENFVDCEDINPSGMRRFSSSPIVNVILRSNIKSKSYFYKEIENEYIISTGVNHHPKEWSGRPITFISLPNENIKFVAVYDPDDFRIIKVGPSTAFEDESNKVWIDHTLAQKLISAEINMTELEIDVENMVCRQKNVNYDFALRLSIFSYLNKKYIDDLRNRRAMLLIDQSLEGYQTSWLWDYFHVECENYKINPNSIIYVTGNLMAEQQYKNFVIEKKLTQKINIIPYTHFEHDVKFMAESMNLNLTVDDHLKHKKENVNDLKTYNCMMKRLRAHRCWWYTYLYKNDLLDDGLVSMNPFSRKHTCFDGRFLTHDIVRQSNRLLPLEIYNKSNIEQLDNFYIRRIVPEVHLDTWVSVVSEASFSDEDLTIFLSEKLFKPIACMHPFIVVGNRGSLSRLRNMGYKTFDGYIDESYDDLPTLERFDAIVDSIKKVQQIKDKFSWYESMRHILEHNYEILERNTKRINPSCNKISRVYKTYFGKK
jgi:hypothetical protein